MRDALDRARNALSLGIRLHYLLNKPGIDLDLVVTREIKKAAGEIRVLCRKRGFDFAFSN